MEYYLQTKTINLVGTHTLIHLLMCCCFFFCTLQNKSHSENSCVKKTEIMNGIVGAVFFLWFLTPSSRFVRGVFFFVRNTKSIHFISDTKRLMARNPSIAFKRRSGEKQKKRRIYCSIFHLSFSFCVEAIRPFEFSCYCICAAWCANRLPY